MNRKEDVKNPLTTDDQNHQINRIEKVEENKSVGLSSEMEAPPEIEPTVRLRLPRTKYTNNQFRVLQKSKR